MAAEDRPPEPGSNGDREDTLLEEEPADITGKNSFEADEVHEQATSSQPAEHTGKVAPNQAKAAAKVSTVEQRIDKKAKAVSSVLEEKERLVLAYIDQRVPYPYCESWRHDTNQNFSLLVRLRHRRLRWPKAPPKAS